MARLKFVAYSFAVVVIWLVEHQAHAQSWPSRPVTMVVPYAAGGNVDIAARVFARELSSKLGQQVIIENKSGAGGIVGTVAVAKAKPDGHTLLLTASGPAALNKLLYRSIPYDTDTEFTPIVVTNDVPQVLVVDPKLPVRNLGELVAYAKQRKSLSLGHAGPGTTGHLASAETRLDFLPQIPTVRESGIADVVATTWNALLAPVGTSSDVVAKINAIINEFLKEDACEEVAYALDVLKLDGVSLFTSYDGQFLGQPSFDPVMAALDAKGSVAFVIEYPFDTTRTATNLIFSGALDRFPSIRFVLAHGGGTLPYLAYRLAMVGSQQLAHREFTDRFPLPFFTQNPQAAEPGFLLARIRRFWFEVALSAGEGTIATIKAVADPTRILFGTDWPYAPETILVDTVAQLNANASLTAAERKAIASDNAQKLFA